MTSRLGKLVKSPWAGWGIVVQYVPLKTEMHNHYYLALFPQENQNLSFATGMIKQENDFEIFLGYS